MLAGYNLRQIPHHFGVQPKTDPLRCDMLRRFLFAHICRNSLFIICSLQNSSYCLLSTISGIFTINALCQLLAANSWRFLFAHICRNSLFIICSLQNSSYCLLSTISGIFTINALLQQPCVPFHFDKQASFATSTPTNFCLQNHKCILLTD